MSEKPSGRVLVVDDDREILTPLCDILSETGYQAECFQSCAKALETFRAKEFDLLLVDLKMPEMDGIEFLKAAQKTDPLVVCIIITGHSTVQTAVEAMKMGAFDYLTKPLNWKILQPVLARAMEVRRIRKSEEQYRAVVEDQTELICRCTLEGTVTFVNEAFCRYFRRKKEEMVGQGYLHIFPAEEHEKLKMHIAGLDRENPEAVMEIEHQSAAPDSESKWLRWMTQAIFGRGGRIAELQFTGCDITERRQAEERLKESEEKYRLLVENANEAIVVAQDGLLKYANQRATTITGYSGKELRFAPFLGFIHPEDREMVFGNYVKRLKGETVPETYSFRIVAKDGRTRWIEIRAIVFSWEGSPATLNFLSDITERKKAEEELRMSHAQLRSFAKRLSEAEEIERQRIARELHDRVGQNVTALGLNLSIVRNQLPDTLAGQLDSRLNDSMSILDEIAKRIRDVMSDLRPSVLDDYGLAAAITWLADQVAKRTGLTIKVESHDRGTSLPPEMEITLFRIAQELLTNITKHAKATEVSIRLDESDGAVLFVVADNGIGFDTAALTATEEPRWGLLNVEERAQAVGGTMTIQSTIGQGTRVAIEVKK